MNAKLTPEQKRANAVARKEARIAAKQAARIEAERNQKPVKRLTIVIEWKKSRTWGNNPVATGTIEYTDGTFGEAGAARASGCGYDKESTVIADLFDRCLRYKLWALTEEQIKGGHGSNDRGPAPYGINCYNGRRSFAGGIGTNCYYRICEYLGGKFEHAASGNTCDVYTATF